MKSICVFCGSNFGNNGAYKESVRKLGALLAQKKIQLVYGGSNVGLMGELARAVLDHGGSVTGIIPEAIHRKVEPLEVTRLIVTKNMHQRKSKMHELSDGFIAMPGGIGTLEEFFEAYTWLQLGFHGKPVALFNIDGFYEKMLLFLQDVAARGFMKASLLDQLLIEENPGKLIDKMLSFNMIHEDKWKNNRE